MEGRRKNAEDEKGRWNAFALDSDWVDDIAVPKVFEQDGYRFFFYSNEHRPIHVHVRYGGGEAVFDVDPTVELRESVGLKIQELAHAQELARQRQALIIEKWHEHLG